jgi:hypothetical protein
MGSIRKPIPDYTGDCKPEEISPEDTYKQERERYTQLAGDLQNITSEIEKSEEIKPELLDAFDNKVKEIGQNLINLTQTYLAYQDSKHEKEAEDWKGQRAALEALLEKQNK